MWGEHKFIQTIVHIGMLLQGTHGKAPANIIDEAIDEALTARYEYYFLFFFYFFKINFRDKIINHNIRSLSIYHFDLKKIYDKQ